MWRQALSELRHHPGRFASTLLAIAISVAFLAGVATLSETAAQAQGRAMNVSLALADVVVTVPDGQQVSGIDAVLKAQDGIEASSAVFTALTPASSGQANKNVQLLNTRRTPCGKPRLPPDAGHRRPTR
jgi:putative ABC transport system permease protein